MRAIMVICACLAFSTATFAQKPDTPMKITSLLNEGYDVVGTISPGVILLKKGPMLYMCLLMGTKSTGCFLVTD
jgi:hypothetical protein